VAVREVERAAFFLGLALGGLVNLIGPEIIVIGGGVTAALGPMFLDLIRESARQQILVDPEKIIKIEPAALGDDAGILGASLMVMESFGS
jgi:glucokinase